MYMKMSLLSANKDTPLDASVDGASILIKSLIHADFKRIMSEMAIVGLVKQAEGY